jgi:protein gp37
LSGRNVCPNASAGCAAACLNTAGRGMMNMVQEARINKTNKFYDNKFEFVLQLVKDIQAGIRFATRKQMNVCFRLNLTSDIRWEKYGIMQEFPKHQFYDYTKSKERMRAFLSRKMPYNYHLTFSRDETTDIEFIKEVIKKGGNVAVVFDEIPKTWEGMEVISGDDHDLRFTDPHGKIIGLEAKGKAKHDNSGFVVKAKPEEIRWVGDQ